MAEFHIFILWEHARYKEQEILADIKNSFTILKEYEILWTPQLVSSNFSRFYGQNLPNNSFKEKECGCGAFLLCIVRDENPKYEVRNTSHGYELVNVNLFDKKSLYREWTGGGHKIHCTTNTKETNHDLTLLLGKNTYDMLESITTPNRERLQRDIEGAKGWSSISHLFYVLNNTVNYVVLRGYKELVTPDPQEDIDLLTDEYANMWLIINAEGFYFHVRPKAGVFIGDVVYYLDIWDSKLDYYDLIWMRAMLSSATMSSENIRVLDEENDFYCLLYHCLTNKGEIAPKHLPKLEHYRKQFDISSEDWSEILVTWLMHHNYDIIRHKDPSNPFNISNPIINKYATQNGICVRITNSQQYDMCEGKFLQWESRVYEKEHSFVKRGTKWLIDNEKRILESLDFPFVPKIISSKSLVSEAYIEMSKMQGEYMDHFLAQRKQFTLNNLREIVQIGLKNILQIYKAGIMHRDIQPDNVLIHENKGKIEVNLIDFASAILYSEDTSFPCPEFLGNQYAPDEMYSDFYSFGEICLPICRKMPYLKRIAKSLQRIQWENYNDTQFVEKVVEETLCLSKAAFVPRDYYAFYRKKYSAWRKYVDNPKLALKIVLRKFRIIS